MDNELYWILGAYIVGTVMGMVIMASLSKAAIENTASLTIDTLIQNGFLKSRKTENGDIELIKYNDEV